MYSLSFLLGLLCTILMCLVAILIIWIVDHIGVAIFAVALLVTSLMFMLVIGGKEDDE